MTLRTSFLVLFILALGTGLVSGQESQKEPASESGGSVVELAVMDPAQPQLQRLPVPHWPADGILNLQGPLPSIIKIWIESDPKQKPLEFGFNEDATIVRVYLPTDIKPASALNCLVTKPTTTHADGVIVLSAFDAEVLGTLAKLESHPGSYRIGYWANPADAVRWEHDIPEGEYEVEVVYSRAPEQGTEMNFQFGDTALPLTPAQTGSWYRYRVESIGHLKVDDQETMTIKAEVTRATQGAMNLKAIVLTPKANP